MPVDTQYYSSCELIKPNRESQTYYKMTYNLWKNKWYKKFKQSWYNSDVNKYNKCLVQSKQGRPQAQFSVDCSLNENKGKGQCSVQAGEAYSYYKKSPQEVPGKTQTGLSDDKGASILNFENIDERILIGGAAVALILLLR